MLSLSFLKILSQFTLMSPIIFFYINGNISIVGTYISIIPFISVYIECIGFEWIKFSIFRKKIYQTNVIVYFLGYILNILVLLFFVYYYPPEKLIITLVLSSLLISLLAQHLIDLFSVESRLSNHTSRFKKSLLLKTIVIDIIYPIIITITLLYKRQDLSYYLSLMTFFLISSLIAFLYLKLIVSSNAIKQGMKPFSIYPYVFTKRLDSQAFRIGLSFMVPPSILGNLFPIIIIARGFNVLGNFINYLNLEKNETVFKRLLNTNLLVISIVILPILISFIANYIINYFNYSEISIPLAAAFISINISTIFRLFSRGVRIKYEKDSVIIASLLKMAVIKFILVLSLLYIGESFIYLFMLYLVLETKVDCDKAIMNLKA